MLKKAASTWNVGQVTMGMRTSVARQQAKAGLCSSIGCRKHIAEAFLLYGLTSRT
jgi:hypothetical protein